VEIHANGVCTLIYCRYVTTFPVLRARKGCAQPSSVDVEPYIRIIAHYDKQAPSDRNLKPPMPELTGLANLVDIVNCATGRSSDGTNWRKNYVLMDMKQQIHLTYREGMFPFRPVILDHRPKILTTKTVVIPGAHWNGMHGQPEYEARLHPKGMRLSGCIYNQFIRGNVWIKSLVP